MFPIPSGASAAVGAASLPQAPPRKPSLFDDDHRRQTLLALGSGILGGRDLQSGLAGATQNLLGLNQQLRAERRPQREFGGPDDAFEIVTDPRTGARTVNEVPAFQSYLKAKRLKAKDVADINGRAMYAVEQLPAEQRSAAYQQMLANPERYGVDPETMPSSYDPTYGSMAASMGMTVAQGQTRAQAASNASDMRDNRANIQRDRETRTGIYRDRSEATTQQGAARVAQGASRLAITQANAGRKGSGGGRSKSGLDPRYEYRVSPDGRVQKRLKH